MSSLNLKALVMMPCAFWSRRDISMVGLLRELGWRRNSALPSEEELAGLLKLYPELVQAWVSYSEDQRVSSGWYLAPPREGFEHFVPWTVGYVEPSGARPELAFPDQFAACAYFIVRQVEGMAKLLAD
ncbi:MAG: hypothetical protein KAI24_22175 [Planctomycetes bacterium]|nr:hypothetical protein [Planctomycetota bacterium]